MSHVYGQCIDAASDDEAPYLPPVLAGFLAEVLARVSASYHGSEEQFILDALHVFIERSSAVGGDASIFDEHYRDFRFQRLPAYRLYQEGQRRRPTPFEAIVETARRLRDLNTIEEALKASAPAAFLGGSTSYGRFYNVAGADSGSPSDIDLLLIVSSHEDIPEVCSALYNATGVAHDSIDQFSVRYQEFSNLDIAEHYSPVLFSGKLHMWTTEADPVFSDSTLPFQYDLSVHIAPKSTVDEIIFRSAPRISADELGNTRIISDFREASPARKDHQRDFSGRNLRLNLNFTNNGSSYTRSSHLFYIDDQNRFYPGMFQNLILPQFDLRWGNSELRRGVEAFRWKMVERLRYERQVRPHEYLRLSLAHTRSQVFAPHTIRSVDSSTLLS